MRLLERTIRYRELLNPLRGLTLQRAVDLLERGERGDYADLQWTYRFVEKRDATVRAVRRRLRDSIARLDWNVKIVDQKRARGWDGRLAEEQRAALREAYDRVENLKDACSWLALADMRGYAHLERVHRPDGELVQLAPIPQWHWCRAGAYGPWLYNPDSRPGTTGIPVDPERLVWREVDDPADEIFLVAHIRKGLSQKDWDAFVEVYGIPWIFLIGPPNLPQDKEAEFQAIAEQMAGDGRGYLPHGSSVETADPQLRTNSPFSEHLKYQDEQIVLAGTGGKLTMLSEATGIGSGASDAHEDTWADIACAQALLVSETLQRSIDKPLLEELFPGKEVLAYFELAAVDAEDADKIVERAKTIHEIGFALDAAELAEKTGLKVTEKSAPVTPPGTPGTQENQDNSAIPAPLGTQSGTPGTQSGTPAGPMKNRAGGDPAPDPVPPGGPEQMEEERLLRELVERSFAQALGVAPDWIAAAGAPILDLLRAAESGELDGDALLERAERVASALPEIVGDMHVERLAGLLEGALGAATVIGVRSGLRDAPRKSPQEPRGAPGGSGDTGAA